MDHSAAITCAVSSTIYISLINWLTTSKPALFVARVLIPMLQCHPGRQALIQPDVSKCGSGLVSLSLTVAALLLTGASCEFCDM